jgi:hypothetical protein
VHVDTFRGDFRGWDVGSFGIDITLVKDLARLFYSRHVNAMGL